MKKINLDRYQIAPIYTIIGGISHYLKEFENGKNTVPNIDNICFSEAVLLRDEFDNLYHALFEKAESNIAIIRALNKKYLPRNLGGKGLTQKEIIQVSKLA